MTISRNRYERVSKYNINIIPGLIALYPLVKKNILFLINHQSRVILTRNGTNSKMLMKMTKRFNTSYGLKCSLPLLFDRKFKKNQTMLTMKNKTVATKVNTLNHYLSFVYYIIFISRSCFYLICSSSLSFISFFSFLSGSYVIIVFTSSLCISLTILCCSYS